MSEKIEDCPRISYSIFEEVHEEVCETYSLLESGILSYTKEIGDEVEKSRTGSLGREEVGILNSKLKELGIDKLKSKTFKTDLESSEDSDSVIINGQQFSSDVGCICSAGKDAKNVSKFINFYLELVEKKLK